jgi:hypothetical protein
MLLLSRKEDAKCNMRSSLEYVGVLCPLTHLKHQLYNQFLPYAQENWLYHTRQLSFKKHFRTWSLWKQLVAGQVHIARLPRANEECVGFGPQFINFLFQT